MKKFKRYFLEVDENLNILKCSSNFLAYIGKEKLSNLDKVIPSQDLVNLKNALFKTEPGEISLSCFRIRTSTSELSWIAATVEKPLSDDDSIKLDISDIQYLKTGGSQDIFDKMTGLYNKSTITDYAKQLMEQEPRKQFYFFLMDVDNFKSVNDTYGHMTGDEVIVTVAEIAKKFVGYNGLVGRIGGDEFMLVLEKINTEPELREILRNIRYTVREKYMDGADNKTITVSMGGGLFPDYADNYDSMFMLADKMLYRAKAKGRDRYIIYTPSVHGDVLNQDGVRTSSQELMVNSAKTELIMQLMDSLLVKRDISFDDAVEKMLTTYNIDGFYILKRDEFTSYYGRKAQYSGEERTYEQAQLDLSSVSPEDYHPAFDTYPIKVVNMYDLQKENYPRLAAFMAHNDYRVLVVYHLTMVPDGGYIVYASNATSSCRFAETDFADLTYFSRMLEIGGMCP